MKRVIVCALLGLSLSLIGSSVNSVNAYSQDPRTCNDPRTQFPGPPPCNK